MDNKNLKKFLDSAGVSHLWDKITTKIQSDVEIEKLRAEEAEKNLDKKFGNLGQDIYGNDLTVTDYVEGRIGEIGKDANGKDYTIKGYVDKVTEGIASSETIVKLGERVAGVEEGLGAANQQVELNKQAIAEYKSTNDKAVADIKKTADGAAQKNYVDEKLADKAEASVVADMSSVLDEVQTTVNNFFSDDAKIDETIDTLKEIVNYLNGNESLGTDIVTSVAELSNKVNTTLNIGDKTVTEYVANELKDYVTQMDFNNTVTNGLGGMTVAQYVDQAVQDFKNGTDYTKLKGLVNAINEDVEALKDAGYLTEEDVNEILKNYKGFEQIVDLVKRVEVLENLNYVTEEYVEGRLGNLGTDSDKNPLTVSAYVEAYIKANILALTSTEIDDAIKETAI